MYDITVEASDEKDMERISSEIRSALKTVKGVTDSEEVDNELEEIDKEKE